MLAKGAEALTRFARKTGIPVTTSLMGLGAFPGTDPLWLGMLGWAPILAGPLGGWIAARSGRPFLLASLCMTLWAGAVIAMGLTDAAREVVTGKVKIVKINDDRKNVVLSRREVIEAERAEQRLVVAILERGSPVSVLHATVTGQRAEPFHPAYLARLINRAAGCTQASYSGIFYWARNLICKLCRCGTGS